ncbi:hypothetical protein Bbelb_296760 [Branchiostoma belcheri]|nr:hypothetical protein Bbelb_296760 [Branchiostoma belcheri]
MTKPKACTVCRLPVKGHDGPYGPGKCGVTLSSPPDASDSDADRRRADRARRSLQKLRRESRIKDLAKGLWSEASDGEQATVRDLREDKTLSKDTLFTQPSLSFSQRFDDDVMTVVTETSAE